MSEGKSGTISEISQHLGAIFRHMLPGVLAVGSSFLAYPDWFQKVDLNNWQQVLVFAVLTMAIGNAWFALNRYGLHQIMDYCFYRWGLDGPAKSKGKPSNYIEDLGRYTSKSLHTPNSSARAWQHVAFRASTVLLIFTIGELAIVFGLLHAPNSLFDGRGFWLVSGGIAVMLVGFWQKAITRRIDYFVVNSKSDN